MKRAAVLAGILVLCIIISVSAFAECIQPDNTAKAQETEAAVSSNVIPVYLFSEPRAIKLPKAETGYWFMVPAGSTINSAVLKLEMEASDTMLGDYSTITLAFNNVNIASANLVELKNTCGSVWEVVIPVELIRTDGSMNELKLITAQRSILGDCADIDNPANWLLLKETSALVLDVESFGPATLATLMDDMFARVDNTNTLAAEFIVSGADKKAESEAVLSIASSIGAANPYRSNVMLPVSTGAAKSELRNRFFISADAKPDASIPDFAAGNGYIAVNSDSGNTTAYILGSNAAGLEKAMRIVLYSDYLSQLTGTQKEIYSIVTSPVSELPINDAGMYTLKDYGYDDITLDGAFHQQTNFQIRQPEGVIGGPDSYFEIHFRHSDALVSDTSLLTVLFNNVAASSIQLSGMNATNGSLRVKIPQEALYSSIISVTVDVYNYLGKIDCSKDWYDVAWTVVDNDSVFYFQSSDTVIPPSLSNFPYFPASVSGSEHKVAFYMPGASEQLLTAAAELSARAGQKIQHPLLCSIANQLTKASCSDSDIVIMGRSNELQLPSEFKELLYITVDPATGRFTVNDKLDTIPEALEGRIIIQACVSPYNSSRAVYTVMWDNLISDDDVVALLRSKTYLESLKGQVAFSSISGGVNTRELTGAEPAVQASVAADNVVLSVRNVELVNRPMTLDSYINMAVNYTGISRLGLLLIALLIVFLIIFIIRSIRVKDRFGKARTNMENTNKRSSAKKAPAKEDSDEDDGDEDEEDFDK